MGRGGEIRNENEYENRKKGFRGTSLKFFIRERKEKDQ